MLATLDRLRGVVSMGGRIWATDRHDAAGAEIGFWLPALTNEALGAD